MDDYLRVARFAHTAFQHQDVIAIRMKLIAHYPIIVLHKVVPVTLTSHSP